MIDVTVRLTGQEYGALVARAQAVDMPVAEYVKQIVLHQGPTSAEGEGQSRANGGSDRITVSNYKGDVIYEEPKPRAQRWVHWVQEQTQVCPLAEKDDYLLTPTYDGSLLELPHCPGCWPPSDDHAGGSLRGIRAAAPLAKGLLRPSDIGGHAITPGSPNSWGTNWGGMAGDFPICDTSERGWHWGKVRLSDQPTEIIVTDPKTAAQIKAPIRQTNTVLSVTDENDEMLVHMKMGTGYTLIIKALED